MKSLMPLDFTKDYFENVISITKIKDIKKEILIKTFEQILILGNLITELQKFNGLQLEYQ